MGGNVVIGDNEAQRIDLKKNKRSRIVPILSGSLEAINKAFQEQNGFPLWSNEVFYSGSSLHFFNIEGIDDRAFVSVRDSVGDIDTQVDILHSEFIREFLDSNKGKTFSDLILIGYKVSGDQYISLWKSKEYNMNIQIDFELVAFESGKPTGWSRFSHSSAWEDLLLGVKGVAHKFIYRALSAKDLKDVVILPKSPRGKEKVIRSAEIAFSTSGLRQKLKPIIHNGRLVYQELSTAETGFITDLGEIFKAFFGHEPTQKEEEKMHSFIGVLGLIKANYSREEQLAVSDGFANTLWGKGTQSLYRSDKERDLEEKMVMVKVLSEHLEIDPSRWNKLISEYYK